MAKNVYLSAMTLKQRLLADLQDIQHPWLLQQLYQFVQLLKRTEPRNNREAVLAFAGTLSDEEAEEMRSAVKEAFDHIEGEW